MSRFLRLPDLGHARSWIRSAALLAVILVTGAVLTAWKYSTIHEAEAAAASQPEPMELVAAAVATHRDHRPTTTSIGTVLALRSVALRNEVPGTVRYVALTPGQIVPAGTVLVALDVSVEQAELNAQAARASLAETQLSRTERLMQERATTQASVDRARAERDVALADMARTRAVIARKTIRAPFRARVGISDVHPGQYLQEGTVLTTLQGVDTEAHVDFPVAQRIATALRPGDRVSVFAGSNAFAIPARIVATDARVDPQTRNATVRAKLTGASPSHAIVPGASVRVLVPAGAATAAVAIPVSALRKGPGGDHVFVIATGKDGKPRAHVRQVQAGPVVGDEVLIVSGLTTGERVAASGSFKLRDAVLVAVANESTATLSGSVAK